MKYWQFVPKGEDGNPNFDDGTHLIQQLPKHDGKWSLWFNGRSQLSLHKLDTAEEVLFDNPRDAVKHCREVPDADLLWIDFQERIFRGKENNAFPPGLGNVDQWIKG